MRVDAALQHFQTLDLAGKALRNIGPVQQHRVIRGEEGAVVVEGDDAEALDLGVGGIEIHDVDLARRERLVGDAVVEAARLLRQTIGGLQPGPAVSAAEKLVRQAEAKRRMLREVGHFAHAETLGVLAPHAERIAIAETQRDPRGQSERLEALVQRGETETLFGLEDLARDRAGVLRIEIDRARLERLEQDRGVAEPGLVGRADALREDLAEDEGLGEALGAYGQVLRASRKAGAQRAERDDPFHPVLPETAGVPGWRKGRPGA